MNIRLYLFAVLSSLGCLAAAQTKHVSQERMSEIFEEVRTPYKYGLVVAPDRNDRKYDCPTVFRRDNKWYMTYVCYNGKGGTDGRGYETFIATSDDLLHWQPAGKVLAFSNDTTAWDANQRGGFPALIDMEWGGSYEIGSFKGQHWMSYIGGHGTGYEAVREPLSIGLSHTATGNLTNPWSPGDKPIMSYKDKDAQWWESLTQYKSTIYKMDKKLFGAPFVMFYNAGGKDAFHPKGERIGIATSKDLKKWKRFHGNPVFAHDTDGTITGDAQIVKMDDLWVMFYFSAFNPTRDYNAFNTFAASYDLVHWQDWDGDDLIVPSKDYDNMFAHKSCVVKWNGTVYHFYCAVNDAEQRGIALATSKHLGKSTLHFPAKDVKGHRASIDIGDDWTVSFDGTSRVLCVPFNLDDYYGARQMIHGNLHGEAMAERSFFLPPSAAGKEVFLRMEGIGTYADISINGTSVGRFDVGRLTRTIDITNYVSPGKDNKISIGISHPEGIKDMPWVCGGCSSEWGFSEGSQPFGIFRPISVELTDKVRIEPDGVHVWSNVACDSVFIETEIHNYSASDASLALVSKLCEKSGRQVVRLTDNVSVKAGQSLTVRQVESVKNVRRWSTTDPYLYTVNSIIKRDGKATESCNTSFGFRSVSWPLTRKDGTKTFRLNDKDTYINGVCEYEHLLGQSHAFRSEQIAARIKEVRDAGFNAFRDAHQPHNSLYGRMIEEHGLLWWPQFSAHIWYDTPQFRESFKRHLRQWVKERRNSPAVILWGLQNESTLPRDFAEECRQIIYDLDPTCGSQRLVTTCNGGEGSDWNVVQNWSGTYGGNIENYARELKGDDQLLNGEYGAWRSIGNHGTNGYPEEKFCDIVGRKVQLAEAASDSVCGQFLWLLTSHDNPGRRQPDEGYRRVDKVGPFNHKGLLTIWEQPTDGYYMYKAMHTNPDENPVVFRTKRGNVWTNCDKTLSRTENDRTVLEGLRNGKVVASFAYLAEGQHSTLGEELTAGEKGFRYVKRINCGGDDYVDHHGNLWEADNTSLSKSWGDDFDGISSLAASQTADYDMAVSPLFQSSRYGRHRLQYAVNVGNGDFRVELFFVEPWYGNGCGEKADYEDFRVFDVAVNGNTVIKNLDIWAEAHYGKPIRKIIYANSVDGKIVIDFPRETSGQAIISAIAVASAGEGSDSSARLEQGLRKGAWFALESDTIAKMPDELLPPKENSAIKADGKRTKKGMEWSVSIGVAKEYAIRWRYHNAEAVRKLHAKVTDQNGVTYYDGDVTFLQTQQKKSKRKMTSITTGGFVNAGTYKILLSGDGLDQMTFDELTVE